MSLPILDELERLDADALYDTDYDSYGSFACLSERGALVEKALPALIRVARAAERHQDADYEYAHAFQTSGEELAAENLASAEAEVYMALQQLRDLGGDK